MQSNVAPSKFTKQAKAETSCSNVMMSCYAYPAFSVKMSYYCCRVRSGSKALFL
jgi:hypothetical protein